VPSKQEAFKDEHTLLRDTAEGAAALRLEKGDKRGPFAMPVVDHRR